MPGTVLVTGCSAPGPRRLTPPGAAAFLPSSKVSLEALLPRGGKLKFSMTSLAFTVATAELHSRRAPRAGTRPGARLRLLPSGDGWALVTSGGEVAFHALGTQGRRLCLEFARARGVLVISS